MGRKNKERLNLSLWDKLSIISPVIMGAIVGGFVVYAAYFDFNILYVLLAGLFVALCTQNLIKSIEACINTEVRKRTHKILTKRGLSLYEKEKK